ncbi:unnamed protein product [Musa acuminata subsp. malaccensis]|uniref:Uncharacterized protein n=1 Tax=Musa acuminata subsp. malaccensis TaxID=214687 RepID=A0A804JVD4_MUSAM|nr:unnamed protein product [Musa acuminata subsp. malaccensis]
MIRNWEAQGIVREVACSILLNNNNNKSSCVVFVFFSSFFSHSPN